MKNIINCITRNLCLGQGPVDLTAHVLAWFLFDEQFPAARLEVACHSCIYTPQGQYPTCKSGKKTAMKLWASLNCKGIKVEKSRHTGSRARSPLYCLGLDGELCHHSGTAWKLEGSILQHAIRSLPASVAASGVFGMWVHPLALSSRWPHPECRRGRRICLTEHCRAWEAFVIDGTCWHAHLNETLLSTIASAPSNSPYFWEHMRKSVTMVSIIRLAGFILLTSTDH